MLRKLGVFIFLHALMLYSVSEQSPIIGQTVEVVENDEFKRDFVFMGSIGEFSRFGVHRKLKAHGCGGALISKRHVLTAAHCLYDDLIYGSMVTFGSSDLKYGSSYEIKSWITYKKWAIHHEKHVSNIDLYDDIAIIILSSDVNGIKPGVISKLNEHEISGQKAITVGWGYSCEKKFIKPDKMQKAYVKVLSKPECEKKLTKIYGSSNNTYENEVCTHADPPVIIGFGDSGGPLLLNSTKEIIGINNSVCKIKNPHKNTNAVNLHIKVKFYKEFINNVLNS